MEPNASCQKALAVIKNSFASVPALHKVSAKRTLPRLDGTSYRVRRMGDLWIYSNCLECKACSCQLRLNRKPSTRFTHHPYPSPATPGTVVDDRCSVGSYIRPYQTGSARFTSIQRPIGSHQIIPDRVSSVQFSPLNEWVVRVYMRDDSVPLPVFFWRSTVSSSGMGRDVHSLPLSIKHFLGRPQRRPPP